MTTIAFDGRFLAADTRGMMGESTLCLHPCRKLDISVDLPIAYAVTGRITPELRARLIGWWETGGAVEHIPPHGNDSDNVGSFIIVRAPRDLPPIVRQLSYNHKYPCMQSAPCGWGSGADFAIGAMEAGLTAMAAVAIAMKHDAHTGGVVEFIDTRALELGVQVVGKSLRPESLPVTPRETLMPRLDPMVETALAVRTIDIRKPSKADHDQNGVKLAAASWLIPECKGHLALGTGCGHCRRCNREWYVLKKTADAEEFSAGLIRMPVVSDGVAFTSIRHPGHPEGPLGEPGAPPTPRQALEDMVKMWNAASAKHDRTAVQNIDRAFRSLQFPPGVEMVTDQPTPEFNHFRRRLVWADEGDTG